MPGEFTIRAKGIVREYLPPATFLVELANGHRLFARVPFKQRDKVSDVKSGNEVSIEISPTDFSNGVL
ncbi:MAG: translation initiation factor IF-1, partial [Verrucomicrobiota bacterium]|nr:translation initiation factor IF-1 [Verrucomicrobiota bacterium]